MKASNSIRKYLAPFFGISVVIGIAIALAMPVAVRSAVSDFYRKLPVRVPGLSGCPDCSVVVLSLDVLRADDLPCYGYARNTAPALCSFARSNSYFTDFYSASPYTMDDHFSMISGLFPSTHHVLVPFLDSLNTAIPTLPGVLQSHGYTTAYFGVTDDPNMPIDKGVGRGYSEIHPMERTDAGFSNALSGVERLVASDKPVFAFVHSYMMHSPYLPGPGPRKFTADGYPDIPVTMDAFVRDSLPFYAYVRDDFMHRLETGGTAASRTRNAALYKRFSDAVASGDLAGARAVFNGDLLWLERWMLQNGWYRSRIYPRADGNLVAYLRGLYDERLVQTDERLKPFLKFLSTPGIRRKTIVIITSDHGEEFMEHGFFEHDNNVFNSSVYVPFILAAPDMKPTVVNRTAGTTDIYPTVLDMLGFRLPKPVDGTSLLPVLSGSRTTGRGYAVSQYRGGVTTSIQDGSWKLHVHTPENGISGWKELYDLVADPGETHNVVSAYPDEAARLNGELLRRLDSSPVYASDSGNFPDWIDTSKRENLIHTGYF